MEATSVAPNATSPASTTLSIESPRPWRCYSTYESIHGVQYQDASLIVETGYGNPSYWRVGGAKVQQLIAYEREARWEYEWYLYDAELAKAPDSTIAQPWPPFKERPIFSDQAELELEEAGAPLDTADPATTPKGTRSNDGKAKPGVRPSTKGDDIHDDVGQGQARLPSPSSPEEDTPPSNMLPTPPGLSRRGVMRPATNLHIRRESPRARIEADHPKPTREPAQGPQESHRKEPPSSSTRGGVASVPLNELARSVMGHLDLG